MFNLKIETPMRVIDSKVHGILDYVMGALLIAAPWLLGFANGGAAQWVPVIIGILTIGQSLMTNYELGAAKIIPLSVHLGIDVIAGVFLAISPWLFGFAGLIFWPHLVFGLSEVMAGLMTKQSEAGYSPQEPVATYGRNRTGR
jgi:hypothetical protein